MTENSVRMALAAHDAAGQRVTTQIVTLNEQGFQLGPVAVRYSWPSELDLMAGQGGLHLQDRYSGWDRQPFG